MHSQPSTFRKVRSLKQRTKIANIGHYKIHIASDQPQLELGLQIVNTATIMANVFASFRPTKNRSTNLSLSVDCSVELSALAIVVSEKIRLRCFRATDKRWKLNENIKIRGRCAAKASVK